MSLGKLFLLASAIQMMPGMSLNASKMASLFFADSLASYGFASDQHRGPYRSRVVLHTTSIHPKAARTIESPYFSGSSWSPGAIRSALSPAFLATLCSDPFHPIALASYATLVSESCSKKPFHVQFFGSNLSAGLHPSSWYRTSASSKSLFVCSISP